MKKELLVLLSVAMLVTDASASVRFETVKDVQAARDLLKRIGLKSFTEEVLSQKIKAPPIHSRYWLDQFARGDGEKQSLERAFRDFGYEVALQLDRMAIETCKNPYGHREKERLDWFLRFSNWILRPEKYENFRIASRAEDVATISLLRVIADLDVPDEEIEAYFNRFMSAEKSAMLRANILFEDSAGSFDVREQARDDDRRECFEQWWIPRARKSNEHYGRLTLRYSLDFDIMKSDPVEYSFFDGEESYRPHCPSQGWNLKDYRSVCVYRSRACCLDQILKAFQFRKVIGKIPEVNVKKGELPSLAYERYYYANFEQEKKQYELDLFCAAHYFAHARFNTYCDYDTRSILDVMRENGSGFYKPLMSTESERKKLLRQKRNADWLKENEGASVNMSR